MIMMQDSYNTDDHLARSVTIMAESCKILPDNIRRRLGLQNI